MPNICFNNLRIRGPEGNIKAFRKKAIGEPPWNVPEDKYDVPPNPLNFHSLVPVPNKVLEAGYKDGQEWEADNWGCKWGSFDTMLIDETKTRLVYYFYTTWCPPLEFLTAVSAQWPTLMFTLRYDDRDSGIKGAVKVAKGVLNLIYEHCK